MLPDEKDLQKEGLLLPPSSRVQSIMSRKTRQWEHLAAGHIASPVKTQRDERTTEEVLRCLKNFFTSKDCLVAFDPSTSLKEHHCFSCCCDEV